MRTKRSGLTLPGALILASIISIGISLTVQSQSVPVGTIGNKNGQVTILGKRVTVFELPISLAAADARYARVAYNNTFTTSHNTFTSPTASPILIKPASAPSTDTRLFDLQTTGGSSVFSIDEAGDVRTHDIATTNGNLTMTNGNATLGNGFVSAGGSSYFNFLTTDSLTANAGTAVLTYSSNTIASETIDGVAELSLGTSASGAAYNSKADVLLRESKDSGAHFQGWRIASSEFAGDGTFTISMWKKPGAGCCTSTAVFRISPAGVIGFGVLPPVYANNAAAVGGGLAAGDTYRTGADPDPLMIVH